MHHAVDGRLTQQAHALGTRGALHFRNGPLVENHFADVVGQVESLRAAVARLEKADDFHGEHEAEARHFRDTVVPAMLEVRKLCDGLEKVMPADLYPMPTYAELLFSTRQ